MNKDATTVEDQLSSSAPSSPSSQGELSSNSSSSEPAPTISTITDVSSSVTSNQSEPVDTQQSRSSLKTFKIVGDNIDKTIKPRDMRIDHQTCSLHYFHSYAARDRIDLSQFEDNPSLPVVSAKDLSTLLPSISDNATITSNFAFLLAQTLVKRVPFFAKYGVGLERHIRHDFYKEMSRKSQVVSIHMYCISKQICL